MTYDENTTNMVSITASVLPDRERESGREGWGAD